VRASLFQPKRTIVYDRRPPRCANDGKRRTDDRLIDDVCAFLIMCIYMGDLHIVRTNIDIDDDLMAAALEARPNSTKRALVEEGLRLVALVHRQGKVRSLRGKLRWSGDLETMRRDRRS
jgi:Arc/MetJ family transcription regulator